MRRRNIEINAIKIYTLIWGQCTESRQSAVKINDFIEEKLKKIDT